MRAAVADCRWLLLTHERELDKLSNTGRLLLNTLPGGEIHVWQRKASLESLLQGRRAVLLFPADTCLKEGTVCFTDAMQALSRAEVTVFDETTYPLDDPLGKAPITWVLLDSTWQQAKKMLHQSTQLQNLPRLSLTLDQPSVYQLRRNQQGYSTLETAAAILMELHEADAAQALLGYLDVFQQHWEAHRSSRTL